MPLEHMHDQLRLRHPKRSFVQHRLDRPGLIAPIGHHLSTANRHPCRIRTISSAGAVLAVPAELELTESFYLAIDGVHDEIPCTEFKRDGDELVVRFNMFLDQDFLDGVLGRSAEIARPN